MSKHQPRIAVLAVHGVADQPPYSTQRMAASLLLGSQLDRDYSEFVEEDILVTQENVTLSKRLNVSQTGDACHRGLQTSVVSRAAAYDDGKLFYEDGQTRDTGAMDEDEIEHESMREQLQHHRASASASSLNTKVLMGKRRADDQLNVDCNVDVYELHWADLSRLKNGFFSAFFEFYLLLFFFSRIGSLTIERAKPRYPENARLWDKLLKTHLTAEFMLVVCVPVAHLCILSLAVSGAPFVLESWMDAELMSSHYLRNGLAVALTLLLLVGGFMLGRSFDRVWPLIFIVIVFIMTCVTYLEMIPPPNMREIVMILWAILAAAFIGLCKVYDKRRPGVFTTALVMFGLTGAVFALVLYSDAFAIAAREMVLGSVNPGGKINFSIPEIAATLDDNNAIFIRGVVATMLTAVLTVLSSLIFVVSGLINSLIGFRVIAATEEKHKDRVRRAVWTGALTLVLPGLAVILITFSLWEIVNWLSAKVLPANLTATYILRDILDMLIFPHLVLGFTVLAVAVGFALWVMSPGPFSDFVEPNEEKNPAKPLGEMLDRGLKNLRYSGEVFRWVLLAGMLADWLYLVSVYPPVEAVQRHVVFALGIAMFTLLFSGKGPFEKITLGFRAGLDVGLDVTNWLRTLPRNTNARAGISRRYASLLRHIATWQDRRDNQNYDAVVIACHSQGTVITADLLRFLNAERNADGNQPDEKLRRFYADNDSEDNNHSENKGSKSNSRLPVYLLTFGSPLRQLYHQRFPHQYAWAGCETATQENCVFHGPDPKKLNVAFWSNIYCSGDYVGRYLWYADDDDNRWSRSASTNTDKSTFYANTRELCAGFGGHTKYWSGSIKPVSEELDKLIVKAARAVLD